MGDMMQEIIFVAIGAAVIGLLFAVYLTASILRQDEGNERVRFIGNAIRQGAAAFLKREYGVLAVFVIVVVIILALFIDYDILGKVGESSDGVPSTAIAYLIGRGWLGAGGVHRHEHSRPSQHAHDGQGPDGSQPALRLAFNSGAVMGLTVVGIGLLGVAILYWIFKDIQIVAGFGMGASSIAPLPGWAAASTPRPPTSEPTSSGSRGGHPRGRPSQPRHHRRQRGRQRGRRCRHGR